jgi:type II secretory pathway component GspD/PulD (secretin)
MFPTVQQTKFYGPAGNYIIVALFSVFVAQFVSGTYAQEKMVPPWGKQTEKSNPAPEQKKEESSANANEASFTLKISNLSLPNAIQMIEESSQKTIVIDKSLATKEGNNISVYLRGATFQQALKAIAAAAGGCVVEQKDRILILSRKEYMDFHAPREILVLKRANPAAVAQLLQSGAAGGANGGNEQLLAVSADEERRSLVLRGDPEQIRIARDFAQELDRSLECQVFNLRYASVSSVAASIAKRIGSVGSASLATAPGSTPAPSLSSGRSFGTIIEDERARQIIVYETPENLAQCKQLIETLDIPVERRVFDIHYASVNSLAEALRKALEGKSTGTPSAANEKVIQAGGGENIVVDPRSNKIIVQDTPERIAICERLITDLDVPVEARVFSTGKIDPKVVAEKIQKAQAAKEGKDGKPAATTTGTDETVQIIEGTNQIIVTDTPERLKIVEKIMQELNENISTLVIQPRHANPTDIVAIITKSFPNTAIVEDQRTSSLVITALKERLEEIQKLIDQLDSDENVQIDIEAKVMLVSTTKLKEVGVHIYGQDLDGLNETLGNLSVNPNFPADSVRPIGSTMGNPPNGSVKNPVKAGNNFLEVLQPNVEVKAVIRALESDVDTTILSNPTVRSMAGQPSEFFAGSREPYKEITQQETRSTENVKFEDVGVTFNVTPLVNPDKYLTLDIKANFSSLREIRDGIPVIDTRKLTSSVQANDGETIFLGGLITQESTGKKAGIPFLKSIPLMGRLFGEKKSSGSQRELLIVITPRLVSKNNKPTTIRQAVPKDYGNILDEFEGEQKSVPPKPSPQEGEVQGTN